MSIDECLTYTCAISIPKKGRLNYKKILGDSREHKRSGIKISETPVSLKIEISAKDATAMRASMNSIMRDIQVIEDAGEA